MSRVRGTITDPPNYHESGKGGTAGLVGDLPVEEAVRVVQEGRLVLDYDISPLATGLPVADLLAALDVGSLSELRRLVDLGRGDAGDPMTVEDVQRRRAEADGMVVEEDRYEAYQDLRYDVLEAIANGASEPAALAREAVGVVG